MNRTCECCGTPLSDEDKSCPVCGKTNEIGTADNGFGNFRIKTLSFIQTSASAFFDPISFYKKSADLPLLPNLITPTAFYLLFFGGIVTEKFTLGYFTSLKTFLIFLGMIPLSAFLLLVSVSIAFYSSKYSSANSDILKIIKTVCAGYAVPSVFAFFGFLFGIVFGFSSYSLLFTGQILTLVPLYLLTSELNRKKKTMTFIPTVAAGIINIVFSSLVFGLKF